MHNSKCTEVSLRRMFLILSLTFLSSYALLGIQYTKEVANDYPYKITKSQKLVLSLDQETVHPWMPGGYFQYLSSENSLAYLNRMGGNIKVFDLATGKTTLTVPLARSGPNSIGNEPSVFYWLNQDSIFIFSNLNNGRLSLINSEGKKLRNYELQSKNDLHFIELTEVAGGVAYSEGTLYLGLRVFDLNKMPLNSSVVALDISSGNFDFINHPQPIEENLWSRIPLDHRYSSTHLALNIRKGHLVMSHPLSSDVLVWDANDNWSTKNAKSIFIDNLVLLRSSMNSYRGAMEKYHDELILMSRYTGVFFDVYRNVYYRIGRLEFDKELYLRIKSGEKIKFYEEFSIQVFDSSFQKIGESKFTTDGVLYEQGAFIDENGLWLLMPQEEDEDVMEFRLMELTKAN